MSDERGTREGELDDVEQHSLSGDSTGDTDALSSDSDETVAARPTGKRGARRSRMDAASDNAGISLTKDARSSGTAKRPSVKKSAKIKKDRRNPFVALITFLRQVVAELRKVIWPNRKQMVTYTAVVLVFVTFMVALIFGLDTGFAKGVLWLFG
ncbi:MAG: preprotein translocase subunit SecE [Mycobacteriaceae bacterium]